MFFLGSKLAIRQKNTALLTKTVYHGLSFYSSFKTMIQPDLTSKGGNMSSSYRAGRGGGGGGPGGPPPGPRRRMGGVGGGKIVHP